MEVVARTLVVIAGVFLFGMMAITTIDVFGRYVLGQSLPGTVELVQTALTIAVACALPKVTLANAHIALGLVRGAPGHPLERIRLGFIAILGAGVLGCVSFVLFQHAAEAARFQDVIGYLQLPVAPMVYVLSAMTLLTALIFAYQVFLAIRGAQGSPTTMSRGRHD